MTRDRDDGRRPGEAEGSAEAGERSGEREARPDRQDAGRVPAPSPEEAPELLGEESDYPIAWEPASDDGER